ncbi:MAG TPA: hypothetical protein VGG04_16895 [Candidatus Sulfotelmatobacter sp.]|jgi:hypothetical protein
MPRRKKIEEPPSLLDITAKLRSGACAPSAGRRFRSLLHKDGDGKRQAVLLN